MKHFKFNLLKIIFFSAILLCIYSCTTTQSYTPDFNNNKEEVLNAIKTQYGFEDITFVGKKQSGSNGDHTSITVKFINGKNIPTDTAQWTVLEKQLGSQVKTIVKDPKEFETYIILFDKKVTDGAVTSENYTGHEFKLSEL